MKNIIKRIILKKAKKLGKDIDGDIILYYGNFYYVNIKEEIVNRAVDPDWLIKIKYPKRFFMNF